MQSELSVQPAAGLRGRVRVPGDKSISHRSLLFASLLPGPIRISGFLPSDDCLATLNICRQLGVPIEWDPSAPDQVAVHGDGPGGLQEPAQVLDVGNAGTAIRLLLGYLAPQPFFSVLTGDDSIRRRPMGRVVEPLRRMGACIDGRDGGGLAPLAVRGTPLKGIHYKSPVASAQVKSALLLAGLFAEGETVVEEPAPSRDHTERFLAALGADMAWEPGRAAVRGGAALRPTTRDWQIPGDFSSAAFLLVAALATPGSDLVLEDVGLNPTRTGLLDVLREMGGDITVENVREWNGEPVGDLRVRSSALQGVEVGGPLIPRLIDELPVFAVAAAHAQGGSLVRDAAELKVKESDRIGGLAREAARIGLRIEPRDDGFFVPGGQKVQGGRASSLGDHRLAMAFAVAGLVSARGVQVEDAGCINVSFPGFAGVLQRLAGEGDRR